MRTHNFRWLRSFKSKWKLRSCYFLKIAFKQNLRQTQKLQLGYSHKSCLQFQWKPIRTLKPRAPLNVYIYTIWIFREINDLIMLNNFTSLLGIEITARVFPPRNVYTVKTRFTAPRFTANPDLPRVKLSPEFFFKIFFQDFWFFFLNFLIFSLN